MTEDGKQTSSSALISQVTELIKNNQKLTKNEKIRLALLVLACVKLNKDDYQKILSLFGESDKRKLINFIAMGVTYDKNISRSTKNIDRIIMERARKLLEERSIPSERFSSALGIFC